MAVPPFDSCVFPPLSRDRAHAYVRDELRAALAQDEIRRERGYASRAFRSTLRALLTPDERAPR